MFLQVCVCPQGGCYPSMHCRWYPSMPCRFPGPHPRGKFRGIWQGGSRPTAKGEVEGDLVQAHSQGGSWGGSGPGPQPRGKLRGIWSRSRPKGEVERDLAGGGGACSGGCLLQGGVCSRGVPALEGCLLQGVCGDPPWWLLLRAICILLEWILVFNEF